MLTLWEQTCIWNNIYCVFFHHFKGQPDSQDEENKLNRPDCFCVTQVVHNKEIVHPFFVKQHLSTICPKHIRALEVNNQFLWGFISQGTNKNVSEC